MIVDLQKPHDSVYKQLLLYTSRKRRLDKSIANAVKRMNSEIAQHIRGFPEQMLQFKINCYSYHNTKTSKCVQIKILKSQFLAAKNFSMFITYMLCMYCAYKTVVIVNPIGYFVKLAIALTGY